MTNIEWINGTGAEVTTEETIAERYFRLAVDDRQYLPEGSTGEKEWLAEAVQAELDVIKAYLYAHIAPNTLPEFLECKIKEGEFSIAQLDRMARELLYHKQETEESTRQLIERFDYLYRYDPRRTDGGRLGDMYSEEMAEVMDELERRYFAQHDLPEHIIEYMKSLGGIDWNYEHYVQMAEALRNA